MEHARPREERVSQEDFPRQGERDSGLHSKSLRPFGAGASKKQGAFRPKLRLKPPSRLVDGSSAADRTLSDLPFPGAKGRSEVTYSCPTRMPVRLVNLPL